MAVFRLTLYNILCHTGRQSTPTRVVERFHWHWSPTIHNSFNVQTKRTRSDRFSGWLFDIAHNTLTNVLRGAQASRVEVVPNFQGDRLGLSVPDDGIGMPRDREGCGHGLRNMAAGAELMSGRLEVSPGAGGASTWVGCVGPYRAAPGGM